MKTKTKLSYIAILAICSTFLTSCWHGREIGRLNLVSVRNIDPHANYVMLQKNVEYTFRECKKHRKAKIEDAVDEVVKKVIGGEYLMNAKIMIFVHTGFWSTTYGYIVEGDVWGLLPTK